MRIKRFLTRRKDLEERSLVNDSGSDGDADLGSGKKADFGSEVKGDVTSSVDGFGGGTEKNEEWVAKERDNVGNMNKRVLRLEKREDEVEKEENQVPMEKCIVESNVNVGDKVDATVENCRPRRRRKTIRESVVDGSEDEVSSDTDFAFNFKSQKGNAGASKVKKILNDTLRKGNLKETMIANSLCSETVDNAGSESNEEKQNSMILDENKKKQDESIKRLERSGTRVLRLLKKRNLSPAGPKRADSISNSKKNHALRVKDNSDVSDVSPSQNSNGLKNFQQAGKRTARQNLSDQLKGILLNAGWTIDLRPRKSRKDYLDSVYIRPDGSRSYWSITKAYAAYQESLKSSGVKEIEKTGIANSSFETDNVVEEGSTSPLSIIPLESVSILRKKLADRGSMVEIEETIRGAKRKAKDISYKKNLKRREKMKVNQSRSKTSDDSLGSYSHASVSSPARKNLQSRRNKHLLARCSNKEAECESDDFVPYAWKRTVLSWMIDLGVVPKNGKVKCMNDEKTKMKLEGLIKRDGIQCDHCNEVVPILKFVHHAGSNVLHASENILVEGPGISLMQCQLDAWEKQAVSARQGFFEIEVTEDDPNDDTCGICGDGGDLICCDSCPSTFHVSCLSIEMLPPGDWNCTHCSCRFCRTVSSSDVQESYETSSLLSCSQCEEKYHQSCVPEADGVQTDTDISGTLFCGESCRKILMQLNRLIGTKNDLEGEFSWSLLRRFDDDSSDSLHSVAKRAECNSKIAVAFAVMDECFLPITDRRSGIDLIHNVVYNCGSNFSRLNYTGFYTLVLERGDEIISAASVRIHGTRLAEMPFIGTRNMYRHQGMARLLLNGIETLLRSLNVEKLVIPAISEMQDTWTNSFGFRSPSNSEELELKLVNLLVFPGVGLLLKPLLKDNSAAQHKLVEAELSDRSNQDLGFVVCSKSPNVSGIVPNLNTSIKCLSDDLLDSAASVAPESLADPNQSEVSMLEHKSSEVDDDECVAIPAAISHDSLVAKINLNEGPQE